MLKRFYINNFKCLQKFEFKLGDLSSAFLLGKNGSGKSTVFEAIRIFQSIGQGVTALRDLIDESSFSYGNKQLPIVFELNVIIEKKEYLYTLSIEYPENFNAPKIKNETLSVNGKSVFGRDGGQTSFKKSTHFSLDWHHIGLPLISVRTDSDPIAIFKKWLSGIIILSPFPKHFYTTSKYEASTIDIEANNVIDWARWLLSSSPNLYTNMYQFLKVRMPDIEVFKFDTIGKEERRLVFIFKDNGKTVSLDFEQLSDGEKIFFLIATVNAAQENNSISLCLWDEPDNFISLIELNHFVIQFRKVFESIENPAQMIITSHNERVLNNFSNNNIFMLHRDSHLLPPSIKLVSEMEYSSATIVDAYDNGELDI